jgi:stage IV sporulation protein B
VKKAKLIFLVGILFIFSLGIYQSLNSYNSSQQAPGYEAGDLELFNNNPVYNFFGLFSGKQEEKPVIELIPGGHSIGVSLQTKGVLVVGFAPIIGSKGEELFPAKEAGIMVGDIILKINGVKTLNDFQVAKEIDTKCRENETITLEIKQKGMIMEKTIQPIFCQETQRYRIGLYIRDEAAGVGTLTFVDPKTKIFGALGHVITDIDTNNKIELQEGKIVESTIHSIEKGRKGDPGEKIGSFMLESSFSGTIEKNSGSGIFGICDKEIKNQFFQDPLPIGWKKDIQPGPAKIYTVIKDNIIEEFEINIEKVMLYRNDNKNMIIRVTDPKLINETGGIIQGMSGSPIIQNGKIVGAVTHVFVNDSSRGYGVFIERMLEESGIMHKAAAALKGRYFLGRCFVENFRKII